jgi:hypothetical protein
MKKLIFSFILTGFLSCICFGQAYVEKGALPFTRKLPPIDKVELIKLKVKGDLWDGSSIEGRQIVEGRQAREIAALWRTQDYEYDATACHLPAYAIKFYSKGKERLYAALCWGCNNICFHSPKMKRCQGFEGKSRKGARLLKIFTNAFPEQK